MISVVRNLQGNEEYLLDGDNEYMLFDTEDEAIDYLHERGMGVRMIEAMEYREVDDATNR